ncbi:MAG: diphthine--ammonia ligase [Longimicrobiales bacterium]
MTPEYGLCWSGGKDSTLALDRALRNGLRVRHLFNLFDAETGRVAFHGVRAELIRRQAEHLGLGILQLATPPGEFEFTFVQGLERLRMLGVTGIIFGNIHLTDVRSWFEERTRRIGFEHVEPLWGEDPRTLVAEVLDRGYRTTLVSVHLERGRREWLGRELTPALAAEIATTPGVDPAGECGEYHSYVFDGPLFAEPVPVRTGEIVEFKGHALVDLSEQTPSVYAGDHSTS